MKCLRPVRTSLGISSIAALLGLLAGCAAPSSERIDARGNYPDAGPGNVEGQRTIGVLVVDTPTYTDISSGRTLTGGPDQKDPVVHSGYVLFNADGSRVGHVRNHSLLPMTNEPPAEVTLTPGRYVVQPDVSDGGPSRFWVTVEALQATRVDVARVGATATPPATQEVR
jgi:hypothetical protein